MNLPSTIAAKIAPATFPTYQGCWIWTGAKRSGRQGKYYGGMVWNGRPYLAHRLVYELLVGPIPSGLELDHLCRREICVNPAHLEPVTQAENNRRSDSPSGQNGRKVLCKHGHDNWRVCPRLVRSGKKGLRRECLTCKRDRGMRRTPAQVKRHVEMARIRRADVRAR